MTEYLQYKHTLASFLSEELNYCKEDILAALNKFQDKLNE